MSKILNERLSKVESEVKDLKSQIKRLDERIDDNSGFFADEIGKVRLQINEYVKGIATLLHLEIKG